MSTISALREELDLVWRFARDPKEENDRFALSLLAADERAEPPVGEKDRTNGVKS